jgi:putative membrane protein
MDEDDRFVQNAPTMLTGIYAFLAHWALMTLVLWITSHVFKGLTYTSAGALWVAALLLGLVNAIVRPILIVLTLPLTLITLGLFLLVINALMLLLVSALVKGFKVNGFWTAFWASLFMVVLSILLNAILWPGPTFVINSPAGTQV